MTRALRIPLCNKPYGAWLALNRLAWNLVGHFTHWNLHHDLERTVRAIHNQPAP